jgi:hypothetical protein
VYARARRAAVASASVPEFANRKSSIEGKSCLSFSATRTLITVGKPSWLPLSVICRVTAATTRGWRWPRMSGP